MSALIHLLRRLKRLFVTIGHKMEERTRMLIFGTNERYSWIQCRILKTTYKLFDPAPANTDKVIVYMTENTEYAGLADRLKTFINSYIIATENQRKLAIYHDIGFPLEKYLSPNEVDWMISPKDIRWGLNRVAFLWFNQNCPVLTQKNKEYHAYSLHVDIIPTLTPEQQQKYTFQGVFNTLFRSTDHLQQLIHHAMDNTGIEDGQFIAFHLRFLNFFEPVEPDKTEKDVTGTPEQQEQMIRVVHATIDKVYRESGCRNVLLLSDSNRFLQAPHPAYIKVLPGTVGHIIRHNGTDKITDKTFTDLMVMAKAQQVYSITGPHIYGGSFARTAAAIGGKPLIEVPYSTAIL